MTIRENSGGGELFGVVHNSQNLAGVAISDMGVDALGIGSQQFCNSDFRVIGLENNNLGILTENRNFVLYTYQFLSFVVSTL